MEVSASTATPEASGADTIVHGVFAGESAEQPALAALLHSGEAKTKAGSLALTHLDGRRHLLVGLGKRGELNAEGARVAAANVAKRALELGARRVAWVAPAGADAGALVEGTILASYRFDRYKRRDEDDAPGELESLTICTEADCSTAVARAKLVAEAVNAARVLQDMPANDMTPSDLAARASELAAAHPSVSASVERRAQIIDRGMGAFAAVAQGSAQDPALITLRYKGPSAKGPVLGFVGKAVTFDSGGISLKPSSGMEEMKFDMSGGAAVIEALGAIAALELPVEIVAVVGATENMPSGRSMRPGDIVRTMKGLTVEINNTDCEGRLVLADCIAHAIAEGAERVVDLATLTGAVVVALGHTYAGLVANDDDWAGAVTAAGEATGEIVWRLPLHAEYEALVNGSYADLTNRPPRGVASSITAAAFLARFADEVPWVHLDIVGTAWELDRAYTGKGSSGWGVRLLVELADQLR
ncbi:MAG: leucyl aminopeptidase [Solirubrobacteraceae bacterium]|jgi:leucyl aminopeptidase